MMAARAALSLKCSSVAKIKLHGGRFKGLNFESSEKEEIKVHSFFFFPFDFVEKSKGVTVT